MMILINFPFSITSDYSVIKFLSNGTWMQIFSLDLPKPVAPKHCHIALLHSITCIAARDNLAITFYGHPDLLIAAIGSLNWNFQFEGAKPIVGVQWIPFTRAIARFVQFIGSAERTRRLPSPSSILDSDHAYFKSATLKRIKLPGDHKAHLLIVKFIA